MKAFCFLRFLLAGIFLLAPLTPVSGQTNETLGGAHMMEKLRNSLSQEEIAWYRQQHEIFQKSHPEMPFHRDEHPTAFNGSLYKRSSTSAASVKRVLVLANKTLYSDATAKGKIDRYISDIAAAQGCKVELEVLEGGKPDSIKKVINQFYANGGLDGVIQIGSLPVPWYESDNDPTTHAYDDYTCDLYYMDLNGSWGDKDGNGKFDGHTKGSGDLGIEVFYARIDLTTMGQYGKEVDLLSAYLDKDHDYYTGKTTIIDSGVSILTAPWHGSENYTYCVCGNAHTLKFDYSSSTPSATVRSNYLNAIAFQYSILQLWCHADYNVHAFYDNSQYAELTMGDVYKANPKPIAYTHDGCHVSDFAAGNGKSFLGGSYVFSKSPTALVVLSGSRSGQWIGLMGKTMYQELGKNTCFGQAFKVWFRDYENTSEAQDVQNFIGWNYGYNIFGDPMITLVKRNAVNAKENEQPDPIIGKVHYAANSRAMTFDYTLSTNTSVDLDLFTITGKRIQSLVSGMQNRGPHSVAINSTVLANGTYIISLKSGVLNESQRLNIVK